MKIKELVIRRTESYQTPASALVGTVTLIDEGQSSSTLVLSPQTLVKIFNVINADLQAKARAQATATLTAADDAAGEVQANLLSSNTYDGE